MAFDRLYRPERFELIVNKQDQFKNINEFKTHVRDNFKRFPRVSTNFLRFQKNQIIDEKIE